MALFICKSCITDTTCRHRSLLKGVVEEGIAGDLEVIRLYSF